jgi:hypothetical protein
MPPLAAQKACESRPNDTSSQVKDEDRSQRLQKYLNLLISRVKLGVPARVFLEAFTSVVKSE